ncbi:MAG: hypothetical protein CSB15_01735 [Clostridiales bacterium]|nr:MAG: hypothetical protein CSB15_01735 [Clostridiales bacterium]
MEINYNEIMAFTNIMVFPHKNPDGDALGSAVAVALAMKNLGKKAVIVIDDVINFELRYLLEYTEFISYEDALDRINSVDLAISVDCGDIKRLGRRIELIKGKPLWNIDHHFTNDNFGDYNSVDTKSASACEIVYNILERYEIEITKDIAEALYTGVSTDTGNFMYSNVTTRTFDIASSLLSKGIRRDMIVRELYQSKRKNKVKLFSKCLLEAEFMFENKLAYSVIDNDIINEIGCTFNDAEGLVEQLRDIENVCVSLVFREVFDENVNELITKVSMRSIGDIDVAIVAKELGGGGHKAASGVELKMPKNEAVKKVVNSIGEKYFK